MLESLKEEVYEANLDLVKNNLVIFTWGNVSAIDKNRELIVIKPSGLEYSKMRPNDMVIVDFSGKVIDGALNPSSDTPTHIEIYKAFKQVGGIVHTHSKFATSFAQSGKSITAYGTTHADYFYGDIPVTRGLSKDEIDTDYEKNTGRIIVETFKNKDIMAIPAVLVKSHGVFAFGNNSSNAVYNATVTENVAEMAIYSKFLNDKIERVSQHLLDKHYYRKHGKNAYYGQKHILSE